MHIRFSPTLDESIHISVSPRDTSVILYFTATLSSGDYHKLTHGNAKLQLWSDISIGTEWGGSDFDDSNPFKTKEADLRDSRAISLCHPKAVEAALDLETANHILSLKLLVPQVKDSRSCKYSFTYRLVFPSGEIQWFGQFGKNGTVVVDLQKQTDVIFSEEWIKSDIGYRWNSGKTSVDGLEVARLAKLSDFTVWGVGREASIGAVDASLVFLVPRASLPSTTLNRNFHAFCATSDISIGVSASGIITASGLGSLTLCTYNAGQRSAEAFLDDVISSSSLDGCSHLILDEDNSCMLLAPSSSLLGHPGKFTLIPLHPSVTYQRVRICLDTLTSHFPNMNGCFLSSPVNPDVHYLTTKAHAQRYITFIVDSSGAEFMLNPAFDLAGGECQVSILTPYDSINHSFEEEADMLPTPPSSPQLDPVRRPSISRRSTISSIAAALDTAEIPRTKLQKAQPVTLRLVFVGLRILRLTVTMIAVWFVLLYRLFFRWPKLLGSTPHDSLSNNNSVDTRLDKATDATVLNGGHVEMEAPRMAILKALPGNVNARSVDCPLVELIVKTKGGLVRMVAHFVDAASPLERIVIEINGNKKVPSHTKTRSEVYLLELDVGDGGIMKIICN